MASIYGFQMEVSTTCGRINSIQLYQVKAQLQSKCDAISEWDEAGVQDGVAEEIVEPTEVPKKWRKRWWNDSKAR